MTLLVIVLIILTSLVLYLHWQVNMIFKIIKDIIFFNISQLEINKNFHNDIEKLKNETT